MRIQIASAVVLSFLVGCGSPTSAQRSNTLNGSGTPGSRTEQVSGIRGVSLSVPGTLVIEVGRDEPLQIEGDDNIVTALVFDRNGNTLEIRAPHRTNLNTNRPLRLRLGVASLDGVSVAGSGSIDAGNIRAGSFHASVAGSGGIVLRELDSRSVDISLAGSGDITIDGRAEDLNVTIAGSGNANLANLEVDSADISVAGSGDAHVNARSNLTASLVGSGDVRFHGNPQIRRRVMGSGEVKRAGDR